MKPIMDKRAPWVLKTFRLAALGTLFLLAGGPGWPPALAHAVTSAAPPNAQEAAATELAPSAQDYSRALEPWFGDYPGMVERRMLRIAVPYSMTHYFLDGATERGVAAAMGRELERQINRREGLRTRRVHVMFIPASRNQLRAYVAEGRADVAMGGLADTLRHTGITFTEPFQRQAQPLLVTGPGAPEMTGPADLAGATVFAQPGGPYLDALNAFSDGLVADGMSPLTIEFLDDALEPDEILEMTQAGLVPVTVADRQLAEFWSQVFSDLVVHENIAIGPPRNLAWAHRENSPELAAVLNEFLRTHRPRTKFGNIISQRYLQTVRWLENPYGSKDRGRLARTRPLFEDYGARYKVDPLLLAALGYQESRLDQATRSPAGAIGVMQLLPRTGASLGVGDIRQLEANIHAGTKYYNYLRDDRMAGPGMDPLNTMLFSLASYNAGHTRIRRLRRQAEREGLDPNVWHDSVELLAAREIGRETVQYVNNVYRYYLALLRVEAQRERRKERGQGGSH